MNASTRLRAATVHPLKLFYYRRGGAMHADGTTAKLSARLGGYYPHWGVEALQRSPAHVRIPFRNFGEMVHFFRGNGWDVETYEPPNCA